MTDLIESQNASQPWGWDFINLAALGRNTAGSYILTVLAVVLFPVGFLVLAFLAIYTAADRHLLSLDGVRTAVFAAAFASLGIAGAALMICVRYLHRRPALSLIAPDFRLDWRRLLIGAGVQGGLLLGVLYLGHRVSGENVRLGGGLALPTMILLAVLIPLQAASEEMLFRGYLTQALGRLIRSRLVIAVIVGLLFGVLHFNAYGALTMPYLFIVSLIFSLASLRDERLELTIGAHTAMNWLAVGAGALGANPAEMRIGAASLLALVVHGALFYALTRILVRLCCEPRRIA